MTKIRLSGLHFNNLYFGPEGPEKAVAPKVLPKPAADAAPLDVTFYLARYNFVDAEGMPLDDDDNQLPELPGQPVDETRSPAVRVNLTGVAEDSSVGSLLDRLDNQFWVAKVYTGGFLSQFTRSDQVYKSYGEYHPPISGPGIYEWLGWGIMYYPGIFRPSRFEQYPQLGLAQMPVVTGNQMFTIDYAKTSIVFEYTPSGEAYLVHGQVL